VIVFALTACRDSEVTPLFDKSADERTAEAIANLKTDLTAPDNGYKLKYKPNDDAGSFHVLLKFNDDNTVRIRTDLSAEDKRYFDDTITYRIDSSLGLELIMET
jgi:major membrane immunogen (membrane-anchored lipoprotein)